MKSHITISVVSVIAGILVIIALLFAVYAMNKPVNPDTCEKMGNAQGQTWLECPVPN